MDYLDDGMGKGRIASKTMVVEMYETDGVRIVRHVPTQEFTLEELCRPLENGCYRKHYGRGLRRDG